MNNQRDLIELAGYWAYKDLEVEKEFTVNGTLYKVIDVQTENPQALTVTNTLTNEATIIYVGSDFSDHSDVAVDALLAISQSHEQFDGVLAYYEHIKENINKVNTDSTTESLQLKHVVGSSLGGAFASYLGVMRPEADLSVVTVDPAPLPPLPEGYSTAGIAANNYISQTSPLYLACQAAGFVPDRFLGQFIQVAAGAFSFDYYDIAKNHVGYSPLDETIGLDEFIPFSIWGDNVLTGEDNYSNKIEINAETLSILDNVLNNRMEEVKQQILKYLNPTFNLIQEENNNLFQRETTIQDIVEQEIAPTLHRFEGIVQQLKDISTSIFSMGSDAITITDINAADILGKIRNMLQNTFEDPESGYQDGFVTKLKNHHEIIEENLQLIMDKWQYVTDAIQVIRTTFDDTDKQLAKKVSKREATRVEPTTKILDRPTKRLRQSPEFRGLHSATMAKQHQVDHSFNTLKKNVLNIAFPLTAFVETTIEKVRVAIHILKTQKQIEYQAQKASWKTIITGTDEVEHQNAYTRIWHSREEQYLHQIEELKKYNELTHGMTDLLNKQKDIYPALLENLKPYIIQNVFSESKFGEVQHHVYTSIGLAQNASLVFEEIWQRVEENEAAGIDALRLSAKSVSSDLKQLIQQMEVIILG